MMHHIKSIMVPANGSAIEYTLADGSVTVQLGNTIDTPQFGTTHVMMVLASAVLHLSERVASLENRLQIW